MGLLVITVALAVVPMSASAQCGGGQMDHSTMGSDHMGSSNHMGYIDHKGSSGHKGSSAHKGSGHKVAGHMGSSGQTAPDHTGNYGYADPNTVSATGGGLGSGSFGTGN